ncbi:unnamed protein product [Lampetra planeri]
MSLAHRLGSLIDATTMVMVAACGWLQVEEEISLASGTAPGALPGELGAQRGNAARSDGAPGRRQGYPA